MISAVWVNGQCTVISGRLQGLVADNKKVKSGKAGQQNRLEGCTIRKQTLIQ